jgi:hypothetical protein
LKRAHSVADASSADPRQNSRQRAVQLSLRLVELEAENSRLREELAQWSMHHAHAASGIRKLRTAVTGGKTEPAELLAIIGDQEVNSGASRFVADIIDGLVAEWTHNPIPNLSRSKVRDWLIAHRSLDA